VERGPLAELALHPDSAAVRLDERLGDCQPEADAAPLLRLPEALPDARKLFGAGMPGPVSETENSTSPSERAARMVIEPFSGVNRTALPTRFERI
jgi:hypothetical protein